MPFILGIVGLLFGALFGGWWGAILLCAAGAWLGVWINRNDETRKGRQLAPPAQIHSPQDAARPFDDFDSLRNEVMSLRRRVEHLESGRPAAKAVEAAPLAQEIVAPPPLVMPTPVPTPAPTPAPTPKQELA